MSLENTSALVTGGASGMGEATGRRLAAEGAQVVVVDRDATKGEAVAADIGGLFCEADVTDEETVKAAVAAAVELAPLRTCIHCAGVGWAERTINRNGDPHDLDRFRKIIEINLIGTFNVLRLAASGMAANEPDADGERGVIVNTASVAAYDGQIGQAAYSASKGGVASLTLTAARDLVGGRYPRVHDRARAHRHAAARHPPRRCPRRARPVGAVPEAPRHRRRLRVARARARAQPLPERRGDPHGRRHSHAARSEQPACGRFSGEPRRRSTASSSSR